MKNKEQWANEVLQSLEGIQRAEPSADLFAKISQKLPKEKVINRIPLKHLSWAAAAACIVIAVNVFVFKSSIQTEHLTVDNYKLENKLLTNYSIYE